MEYFITVSERTEDDRLYVFESHFNTKKKAKEYLKGWTDRVCSIRVKVVD